MNFRKNLGTTERVIRLLGGALLMAVGIGYLNASVAGLALAGAGLIGVVTGALRYCPACALAGRKALER